MHVSRPGDADDSGRALLVRFAADAVRTIAWAAVGLLFLPAICVVLLGIIGLAVLS